MTDLPRRAALIAGVASGAMAALRLSAAQARVARAVLPIPPELRADARGVITLGAGAGTTRFMPGQSSPTSTYGYNAAFLGPALRLRRGQRMTIDFTNHLPEPTTVHWHGLIIPGEWTAARIAR